MNKAYTCRICLEEENNCKNLVSPCQCKGTQKYIHKECLKRMTECWDNCPTCDSVISNNKYIAHYYSIILVFLLMLLAIVLSTLSVVLGNILFHIAYLMLIFSPCINEILYQKIF